MKWSLKLLERKHEGYCAPFIWWVKKAEAEKKIREISIENKNLKSALISASRWGIKSEGFSAEVSDSIRTWVDNGMIGKPPETPSYYPK